MTYEEALSFIHSIPKFRRPLGNANLSKLLSILSEPQKKLEFIHIAGTNGKGSTAAMTAKILEFAGFRTGLFTSPFLEVFNERIRINGKLISDRDLASYTERVKNAMETGSAPVSEFAFITAAAFLYFYEQKCDIVVLEVGMGGALDATNVIDASLVSVLCKIGLDHTQYLGSTVEEIAEEKCGIIREGGEVVSYRNTKVMDIIERRAKERRAHLTVAPPSEATETGFMCGGKEYELSLKGSYQAQNAAVVLEIVRALRSLGKNIDESAVKQGFASVEWPARFEFVRDNVIIDGGHNSDGIKALKKELLSLGGDIVLVMAMMSDKDYEECIREIAPVSKHVFATSVDMPRCLNADIIADIVRGMNIGVSVHNNPVDAVEAAMAFSENCTVCVCGSLFLAGEIRNFFRKNQK